MTFQDALNYAKAAASKAYAFSPAACWFAAGYFSRPFVKPALSAAFSLAKAALHL